MAPISYPRSWATAYILFQILREWPFKPDLRQVPRPTKYIREKAEEIWWKIGFLWQLFHIPDRVYLTVAAGYGGGGGEGGLEGFLGQYYTIYGFSPWEQSSYKWTTSLRHKGRKLSKNTKANLTNISVYFYIFLWNIWWSELREGSVGRFLTLVLKYYIKQTEHGLCASIFDLGCSVFMIVYQTSSTL